MNINEAANETALELSQRAMARLLGVSAASIVAWERDAGLPSLGDRGRERFYDAAVVVQWYLGRELVARGAGDEDRKRLVRAQAARAELEVLTRKRELVSVREVQRVVFNGTRALRENILAVPDRIATTLVGERDPTRLHALLTDALKSALLATIKREPTPTTAAPPRIEELFDGNVP